MEGIKHTESRSRPGVKLRLSSDVGSVLFWKMIRQGPLGRGESVKLSTLLGMGSGLFWRMIRQVPLGRVCNAKHLFRYEKRFGLEDKSSQNPSERR